MNCLQYVEIKGKHSFPFFEDYLSTKTPCKVYSDGGAYIGIPVGSKVTRHQVCNLKSDIELMVNDLYKEAVSNNISPKDIPTYIRERVLLAHPDAVGLDDFISRRVYLSRLNLFARKKRFRRKAFLNKWNYFLTFTYDCDRHSEKTFKEKLRKCLSNLHSRRGWLYMGVWERAPETGRLHFHAVAYVPDGQMVGNIYERRDYSTKKRAYQITHPNTFFEARFGRCDFAELSDAELKHGNTMSYLLKYLEKSNERIVYSRGIPSEFYKLVDDSDVACEFFDFVRKLVLFDDAIRDYDLVVSDNFLSQPLPHLLN